MGGKGADGLLVGKAHYFVLIHFGSAAVMSS